MMISNTRQTGSYQYNNPFFPQNKSLGSGNQMENKAPLTDSKAIKDKLRALNSPAQDYQMVNGKKVFSATTADKKNGFLQLFDSSINDKLEEIKTKPKYKYKEVSSKIRSAKTSLSAGQALIAAKRSVSEIKRQIRSDKENSDELILDLSHARRMEMAARKKKHHLELEELVENAQKNNVANEEGQEETGGSNELNAIAIEDTKTQMENSQDEIFKQREKMMEELSDEYAEMISEFGEEELKQLEEAMETLELMEVVDPNMSEEDFKKLKIRHRNSEEKSLVKADMDYLKGLLKLYQESKDTKVSPVSLPGVAAPALPNIISAPDMAAMNPTPVSGGIDVVV